MSRPIRSRPDAVAACICKEAGLSSLGRSYRRSIGGEVCGDTGARARIAAKQAGSRPSQMFCHLGLTFGRVFLPIKQPIKQGLRSNLAGLPPYFAMGSERERGGLRVKVTLATRTMSTSNIKRPVRVGPGSLSNSVAREEFSRGSFPAGRHGSPLMGTMTSSRHMPNGRSGFKYL